ncbi:hypothetical protein [Streptomyces violaceusniger]|uniref:hypothetical protein n=1 Tax=Streptomyces violaceusniger TaxID=68280 RepID=UPI00368DBD68
MKNPFKSARATKPAEEYLTYPVVPDTNEAVAAKLRRMADESTDPTLARLWRSHAESADNGLLHPIIRSSFANGIKFSK